MIFDYTICVFSACALIALQEPIFSYVKRTFHFITGKKRKINHDEQNRN